MHFLCNRHCPQLTELNLFARRNLTASNLHQIAIYCPNLQRLDLSFSTSSSFSALTMLTNITDLTLCETRIGDSDVQILQTLSNLTRLDVEATCLSGTGLTELLMKLTKLRHLNASNLYFDQQSRTCFMLIINITNCYTWHPCCTISNDKMSKSEKKNLVCRERRLSGIVH